MSWLDYAAGEIGAVYGQIFARENARTVDASAEGVFRSFRAFPLSAVFAFGLFFSAFNGMSAHPKLREAAPLIEAGLPAFLAANAVAFVIVWTLSLVAVASLANRLAPKGGAARAIASYNWLQPPLVAVQFLPFGVLAVTGQTAYLSVLSLPALVFLLFVAWRFVRMIYNVNIVGSLAIMGLLTAIDVATSSATTATALAFVGK